MEAIRTASTPRTALDALWLLYWTPRMVPFVRESWAGLRPRIPVAALELIERIDSALSAASTRSSVDQSMARVRFNVLSTWLEGYEAGVADGVLEGYQAGVASLHGGPAGAVPREREAS